MMAAFLLLLVALLLSAGFAGVETGIYGINPLHLRHEARRSAVAAMLARSLRRPRLLLAALLLGNNFALDLATHAMIVLCGAFVEHPHLVATLTLAPIVLLLGEILPKRWFLRRPLRRVLLATPLIAIVRFLLTPFAWMERRSSPTGSSLVRPQLLALLEGAGGLAQPEAVGGLAARTVFAGGSGGLLPWLRTDLIEFPADTPRIRVEDALRRRRGAVLLGDPEGGVVYLGADEVLGAAPADRLLDLGRRPPRLEAEWSPSRAVEELRKLGEPAGLVFDENGRAGVWDLEYFLDQLLSS